MTTIATLAVRLDADIHGLTRNMSAGQRAFDRFGERVSRFGRRLTLGVTAPAAAAATGLLLLTNRATQFAEEITVMSARTGLSMRTLQELRFVTDQVDVSFTSVQSAIAAFSRQLPVIVAGSGPAAAAFRSLGVSLRDSRGQIRPMAELFPELLRALSSVRNETVRNALAMKVFGRGAVEIVPLLAAGTEEIERLSARANELGLVMSDQGIRSLEEFGDQMSALKLQLGAAARELITTLLPVLRDQFIPFLQRAAIPAIRTLIERIGSISPETAKWVLAIGATVAVMGPLLSVIGSLTSAIAALTAIGASLAVVVGVGAPLLLGLAALIALFARSKIEALLAAGAMAAYRGQLAGLNITELSTELQRVNSDLREQRAELERLRLTGGLTRRRTVVGGMGQGVTFTERTPAARRVEAEIARLEGRIRQLNAATAQFNAAEAAARDAAGNIPALDINLPGAEATKTWAQALQERMQTILGIHAELTDQQRDLNATTDALVTIYNQAHAALGRMGNALTEDRRILLDVVGQVRDMRIQPMQLFADVGSTLRGAFANVRTTLRPLVEGMDEAARQWRDKMVAAAKDVGGALKRGVRPLQEAFAGMLESALLQSPQLGTAVQGARAASAGGASVASAGAAGAALAVATEFLSGVMQTLGPAFEALLLPIRMVGEVFGKLLLPILKLVWPIMRVVAIGLTYLGQAVANVAGAILSGAGWLLKGIGKLVNLLPGSLGKPLIRAGQALQRSGQEMYRVAGAMKRTRDELGSLSFEDAMGRVTDSANQAADAMINLVEGFKVEPFRHLVVRGRQMSQPAPAPAPTGGGGGGGQPSNSINVAPGASLFGDVVIQAAPGDDGEELWRKWRAVAETKMRAQPHARSWVLAAPL